MKNQEPLQQYYLCRFVSPYWTTNSFYFILFYYFVIVIFNILLHIELYRLGPSSFYGKNIEFSLFCLHKWKRGWKFYDKEWPYFCRFYMNGYTSSSAPNARLTPYLNPLSPQQSRSLRTHAGVFISGFCTVRIVSRALHSNMDVEETAYSHPV